MFKANFVNKIENGRSSFENTGTRLEQELLGEVNTRKYKELAYAFLHQDEEDNLENKSQEEKFEKIIKIREAAQKEFENALSLADRDKYIDFKNSVNLVEKTQIGDPENPNHFFAKALLKQIKDRFADKYTLKFFTATGGTHLDVCHGVDFFIKLYDKKSEVELAFATVDITKNDKKDKARANVLININQEESIKIDPSKNNEMFDKELFLNKITDSTEKIVNALIEDYKQRNHIK
jgi:hypothetical protein